METLKKWLLGYWDLVAIVTATLMIVLGIIIVTEKRRNYCLGFN